MARCWEGGCGDEAVLGSNYCSEHQSSTDPGILKNNPMAGVILDEELFEEDDLDDDSENRI